MIDTASSKLVGLSLGPDHPNSQLVADNYISLLQALGHTEAEITESLRTLLD